MTLTLELPPELETRLHQEAARKGVEPETLVREVVARHLRRSRPKVKLTAEEQASLNALNAELSPSFWKRYRTLQNRRRAERLTEAEHTELLQMVQETEAWNVRRLTLLEQMAQAHGMHFPELMTTLGIRHHPDAGSA
jgi:hypothetical protein